METTDDTPGHIVLFTTPYWLLTFWCKCSYIPFFLESTTEIQYGGAYSQSIQESYYFMVLSVTALINIAETEDMKQH
jgi:hypothetical protein